MGLGNDMPFLYGISFSQVNKSSMFSVLSVVKYQYLYLRGSVRSVWVCVLLHNWIPNQVGNDNPRYLE